MIPPANELRHLLVALLVAQLGVPLGYLLSLLVTYARNSDGRFLADVVFRMVYVPDMWRLTLIPGFLIGLPVLLLLRWVHLLRFPYMFGVALFCLWPLPLLIGLRGIMVYVFALPTLLGTVLCWAWLRHAGLLSQESELWQ